MPGADQPTEQVKDKPGGGEAFPKSGWAVELDSHHVDEVTAKRKFGPSYCIILGGFLIKGNWVISNFYIILVKIYPTNDWSPHCDNARHLTNLEKQGCLKWDLEADQKEGGGESRQVQGQERHSAF